MHGSSVLLFMEHHLHHKYPCFASKAAEDDISKLGPVLNKPFAVPALELSPSPGLRAAAA